MDISELSKDVPDCVLFVYEKLSPLACKRFVPCQEFLETASDYMDRVGKVWAWQSEKGTEHRLMFRDCTTVKTHQSYR